MHLSGGHVPVFVWRHLPMGQSPSTQAAAEPALRSLFSFSAGWLGPVLLAAQLAFVGTSLQSRRRRNAASQPRQRGACFSPRQ